MRRPLRVVVLGTMGRAPFGGQTWLFLNWLQAFRRLGHDVWYVEDDIVWLYDPVANVITDDCRYAVDHVARCLEQIGMRDHWAFRFCLREDHCWGLGDQALDELYASCDLLVNACGATELREPHMRAPLRLYLETDPVTAELRVANGDAHVKAVLEAHTAFATYGENYGAPDCGVPLHGIPFVKIRQPVDLDWWPSVAVSPDRRYTTIGNYRQRGRDVAYRGQAYRWSKHHEWEVFADLPRHCTTEEFELAMVASDRDRGFLEAHGWRVVPALPMSLDVFGAYRKFIQCSKAEFTVAKDQNIRLRSGWFSERDACYLASGKPVVCQDTGFSSALPTGKGLFSFATMEEAVEAVEAIHRDYELHCRGARTVARECFDAPTVASQLLRAVGLA